MQGSYHGGETPPLHSSLLDYGMSGTRGLFDEFGEETAEGGVEVGGEAGMGT